MSLGCSPMRSYTSRVEIDDEVHQLLAVYGCSVDRERWIWIKQSTLMCGVIGLQRHAYSWRCRLWKTFSMRLASVLRPEEAEGTTSERDQRGRYSDRTAVFVQRTKGMDVEARDRHYRQQLSYFKMLHTDTDRMQGLSDQDDTADISLAVGTGDGKDRLPSSGLQSIAAD